MNSIDYLIYADESDSKGKFYSDFYGGLLIPAHLAGIYSDQLNQRKADLNLGQELKWQKITEAYFQKYKDFIDAFFDLMAGGDIKIRVMFTDNRIEAVGLTSAQKQNRFTILYYQFARHALGLRHLNADQQYDLVNLRFMFDELPDRAEAKDAFKGHIRDLPSLPALVGNRFAIPNDGIAEVNSKSHVLLQALDIILGSVSWILNDKYSDNPGGKKTEAKRRLAEHILFRVRALVPGFDPRLSTLKTTETAYWDLPYRHWCFTPKNHKAR
jgi:Protein of unknown function (DUF3800)